MSGSSTTPGGNTSTTPTTNTYEPFYEGSCKFCVVHVVGVYVLNIGGLLILSVVLFFYWNEIVAYFRGTAANKGNISDPAPESPTSPPQIDSNIIPSEQNAMDAQLLPPPPTMMLPTPPPPPLPPPAPPYQPEQTMKTTKEVTPRETLGKKSHESTGSTYFKQMMKGKKPVASISQYQLMKKGQQKKGKMKHVHHHKNETKDKGRDKKAKKEAEVKKFLAEAKKLTKGLPS